MSAVRALVLTVSPERRTDQVLASQGESSGRDWGLSSEASEILEQQPNSSCLNYAAVESSEDESAWQWRCHSPDPSLDPVADGRAFLRLQILCLHILIRGATFMRPDSFRGRCRARAFVLRSQ